MARNRRTIITLSALLAVVLPYLYVTQSRALAQTHEVVLKSHLFLLRNAIDEYTAHKGQCPESLGMLEQDRYVHSLPVDPFTKSSATWRYTRGHNGTRPTCDIRSGSNAVARDGNRYADW